MLFFRKTNRENLFVESKNDIFKYLGVFMDNNLFWEHYIRFVVQKLSIAKAILRQIFYYVLLSVLRNVNFGLTYPYLFYSITSWVTAASKYTN